MKQIITSLIIVGLCALSCFADTKTDSINPLEKLVVADNDFGFRMFSELIKQDQISNIFISPPSITMALTMTYNGAAGETKKAMAKTLGLEKMSLKEVNEANRMLKEALKNPDSKVELKIANSLWTKKGIKFRNDFLTRNEQFYDAEITAVDFTKPNAPNIINKWVKEKTQGKIEKIVEQIDPIYTMLFLINAVYFKGLWQKEFNAELTKKRPFTLIDGKQKQHPMMSQSGNYLYLCESHPPFGKDEKFQAVNLPYGQGRMSMYIFLPNLSSNLNEFLKELNSNNWENWLSKFSNMDGNIILPRFKLEYAKSLNAALKTLGMDIAFNLDNANFSGMLSTPTQLYISQVMHKTFVEVNEKGTEAAAVTSVEIRATSIREPKEFTMVVDRPFFCAIRDNQTGSILFMGAIVEPW